MKISVDAGALCVDKNHRFGNYIFTENFLKASLLYDRKNVYYNYTFCKRKGAKNLQPKVFWSTLRTSVEEWIEKKDYYFALNQALPLLTPAKIISFSHGLSFYYHPKLYPDSTKKMINQHKQMIRRSYKIVVPSIKIKEELHSIFPSSLKLRGTNRRNFESKIIVIPYGVPFDMLSNSEIRNSKFEIRNFFLVVGMDHLIKNHRILPINKYKFVIATNTPRMKLKKLYQQATALVTTSLYESFNLPVLEALSQGCPVIGLKSAIIPELTPYVNVCQDQKELLFMLEQATKNKLKTADVKEIRNTFSWKNYVRNIQILIKK